MLDSMTSHPAAPYVIGGVAAIATAYAAMKMLFRRKPPVYPRDTVVLHQIGRGWWAPNPSQFVMKLETYLRIAKVPYINDFDFPFSSKSKTPWITYNDEEIADSQFCLEYIDKMLSINLDKHLTEAQKGVARAFLKMAEENTYWCTMVNRWRNKYHLEYLHSVMPRPAFLILRIVGRSILNATKGQGMGRHSQQEVQHILNQDLQALSSYMGNNPYLMGSNPSVVDCGVFGMLAQIKWQGGGGLLDSKALTESFPNLSAYCDRMKEEFWPDWDECITHGATRKATK